MNLAPPLIIKSFDKQVEAQAENPLVLEVICTGNPLPTISWTKERKAVEEDENLKLTSEILAGGQVLHRLTSFACSSSDAGNYAVEAKNPLGKATAATKVDILHKPLFKKELSDMYVKEKDTVKLTAEIEANPKAEVTWLKKIDTEEVNGDG